MTTITPVRIISLFIVFYFLYYYVVKYIGLWIVYRYERNRQKKQYPVSHIKQLHKPNFLNIKHKVK